MTSLKDGLHQTTLSIQIERLPDKTSIITIDENSNHGFSFATPVNWYPVAIPATEEEVISCLVVIETDNIPLGKEWVIDVLAIDDEEFNLLVFDFDPNHSQYEYTSVLFGGKMEVPDSTPNWTLFTFLKGAELADDVKLVSFEKIDDQLVGVVEFAVPMRENETVFGKMLIFVRNGELILLFGGTDNYEWATDINNAMDFILASLDFDIED